MKRNDDGFQKGLALVESMAKSPRRFLFLYLILATKRLKELAEESAHILPVNRRTEDVPAWVPKVQKHIGESENLQHTLQRAERYLGHKPKKIDPTIEEDTNCLATTRWVRTMIDNGDPNEEIAGYLRRFLTRTTKGKRGRPAGTVDYDGYALTALAVYEGTPGLSYRELADRLLEAEGREGPADSEYVDKLKKAVIRLRRFLQELGYEPTRK